MEFDSNEAFVIINGAIILIHNTSSLDLDYYRYLLEMNIESNDKRFPRYNRFLQKIVKISNSRVSDGKEQKSFNIWILRINKIMKCLQLRIQFLIFI